MVLITVSRKPSSTRLDLQYRPNNNYVVYQVYIHLGRMKHIFSQPSLSYCLLYLYISNANAIYLYTVSLSTHAPHLTRTPSHSPSRNPHTVTDERDVPASGQVAGHHSDTINDTVQRQPLHYVARDPRPGAQLRVRGDCTGEKPIRLERGKCIYVGVV